MFHVTIDGQQVAVDEQDVWTKAGINRPIIKHDGVRRLMVKAGIKLEEVRLIISPSADNNMRTVFLAVGTNAEGRRAFGVTEQTRSAQPVKMTKSLLRVIISDARTALACMEPEQLRAFLAGVVERIIVAPSGELTIHSRMPREGLSLLFGNGGP